MLKTMSIACFEWDVFFCSKSDVAHFMRSEVWSIRPNEVKFAHLRQRRNLTVRRTTSLSKITSLARKGKLS